MHVHLSSLQNNLLALVTVHKTEFKLASRNGKQLTESPWYSRFRHFRQMYWFVRQKDQQEIGLN